MPYDTPIGIAIFFGGVALLGILLGLLFWRKRWREFPLFTVYVGFQFSTAFGLWILARDGNYAAYWYFFWSHELVDAVLSMMMVLEIFKTMLRTYPAIQRLLSRAALASLCGVAVVAAFMIWTAPDPDTRFGFITPICVLVARSADFLRFGLLFALFLFCRFLGLHWRNYIFGIAMGLGVSSALSALNDSMRLQITHGSLRLYEFGAPLSFDLGVLVWIYYFAFAKAEARVEQPTEVPVLARWNSALEQLLAR